MSDQAASPMPNLPTEKDVYRPGWVTSPFTYRSASITKLTAALSKAQKAFGAIEKTKTAGKQGEGFSYKYADLANVIAATVGPLADNELMLTQLLVIEQGKQFLLTELHHVSGEWIQSKLEIQPMRDPKAFGSTLTYARRYSEQAILNVAAEEDLDGATPDDKGPRQNSRPEGNREPRPPREKGQPKDPPPGAASGFVGDAVIPLTAPEEVKGKKLRDLDANGIAAIQAYYANFDPKQNKQMHAFKVIFERFLGHMQKDKAPEPKAEPQGPTPHSEFAAACKLALERGDWTPEKLKNFSREAYLTADSTKLEVHQVIEFTKFVGMPFADAKKELDERLAAALKPSQPAGAKP